MKSKLALFKKASILHLLALKRLLQVDANLEVHLKAINLSPRQDILYGFTLLICLMPAGCKEINLQCKNNAAF